MGLHSIEAIFKELEAGGAQIGHTSRPQNVFECVPRRVFRGSWINQKFDLMIPLRTSLRLGTTRIRVMVDVL
jgi:hypothetical protein